MTTKHGGDCFAKVMCDKDNGGDKEYKKFSACRVGGESKFEDPRIGPFSITFSERDGEFQGEGLTSPIIKLAVGTYLTTKHQNEADMFSFN